MTRSCRFDSKKPSGQPPGKSRRGHARTPHTRSCLIRREGRARELEAAASRRQGGCGSDTQRYESAAERSAAFFDDDNPQAVMSLRSGWISCEHDLRLERQSRGARGGEFVAVGYGVFDSREGGACAGDRGPIRTLVSEEGVVDVAKA